MPGLSEPDPRVALTEVTALVLEQLLALAVHDADADEVTPPLGSAEGWNPERIGWFRAYHRAACGLDGPARENAWAVTAGGAVAGSVRLRRVPDVSGPGVGGDLQRGGFPERKGASEGDLPGHGVVVETGIWLGRRFRGRGIGAPALLLVKAKAAGLGAGLLVADTDGGNRAAQALLRSAGAELTPAGQRVTARITLA